VKFFNKRKEVVEMCKLSDLTGQTADGLLQKYNLGASVPVDMDKLLKGLHIVAQGIDFTPTEVTLADRVERWGNILGAVSVKDGNVSMFYRNDDTRDSVHFTIAHELAHCCLHADKLSNGHILMRYDGYFADDEEKAANEFAGELLIPEAMIRNDYINFSNHVIVLATSYDVPVHVMASRLKRLNLPLVGVEA